MPVCIYLYVHKCIRYEDSVEQWMRLGGVVAHATYYAYEVCHSVLQLQQQQQQKQLQKQLILRWQVTSSWS